MLKAIKCYTHFNSVSHFFVPFQCKLHVIDQFSSVGRVFKWDLQWMRDTLTEAVIIYFHWKVLFWGTFANKDITQILKAEIQ